MHDSVVGPAPLAEGNPVGGDGCAFWNGWMKRLGYRHFRSGLFSPPNAFFSCYRRETGRFGTTNSLHIMFRLCNHFPFFDKALDAGVDAMTPAYYMVVRLARVFSSDAQLALQLPSIAGYLLSLLGTYWFARKRLPAR